MIYLIGNWELQTVKIGFSQTSDGVFERVKSMQVGNCCQLEMLSIILGEQPREFEIHEMLSAFRKRGEWFFLTDQCITILEHWFPFNLHRWKHDRAKENYLGKHKDYADAFVFLAAMFPDKPSNDISRLLYDENKRSVRPRRKVRQLRKVVPAEPRLAGILQQGMPDQVQRPQEATDSVYLPNVQDIARDSSCDRPTETQTTKGESQ